MKQTYSQKVINKMFDLLEIELEKRPLPTRQGSQRYAAASEFMLMFIKANCVYFKHKTTRNYIILDYWKPDLYVPQTTQPFFRGTFEAINPVAFMVAYKKQQKEE